MTDPNRGLGGSYVIDPATGERKLEERTASLNAAPIVETAEPKQPAGEAGKVKKVR